MYSGYRISKYHILSKQKYHIFQQDATLQMVLTKFIRLIGGENMKDFDVGTFAIIFNVLVLLFIIFCHVVL